jgi:hypothetical protein
MRSIALPTMLAGSSVYERCASLWEHREGSCPWLVALPVALGFNLSPPLHAYGSTEILKT